MIIKIIKKGLGINKLERKLSKLNDRCNALSDLLYYHDKYFHKNDIEESNNNLQEETWGGIHGYRYVMHHLSENWEKTRISQWKEILCKIPEVNSFFELGANIGANLLAIRNINSTASISGIEINPLAVRICKEREFDVSEKSIIGYESEKKYDFVFSRGVLIHIPPKMLNDIFRTMYNLSDKYILIWEIFSKEPYHFEKYSKKVINQYRYNKNEGFQFWEDFAMHFKTIYPEVEVVATSKDHNSINFGDLVWTLFKKKE